MNPLMMMATDIAPKVPLSTAGLHENSRPHCTVTMALGAQVKASFVGSDRTYGARPVLWIPE